MQLEINGTPQILPSTCTIAEMLTHLRLVPETVLIEHNGIALHRHEWITIELAEGDRIEILQVAAGG